jgi:hypothetical protein
MKRHFTQFILAVVAIGSIGLGSCNKSEDDPAGGGGTKSNSMTATLGSKALNTETIIAEYDQNGYIDITANDKDQATAVSINFDVNGASTQTVGGTFYPAVQLSPTIEGLYIGETGTITLTTNDKAAGIVQGTFSFNCRNSENKTIQVTGGTFYVKYNK